MTYKNDLEYFKDITENKERVKPIVHYSSLIGGVEINYSATVVVVDHPAKYLNDEPFIYTSYVVSYDEETGEFETRNTKYVPLK